MKPGMLQNDAPRSGRNFWVWIWLASATLIPGGVGSLCLWYEHSYFVVPFAMVLNGLLHIYACAAVGAGRSGWLKAFLVLGGLVLMLASFFAGCISGVPPL